MRLPGFIDYCRVGIHNIPHDLSIQFSYEIQFWNKILAAAHVVQAKMLVASWKMNVPEGFAGQLLDGPVVAFLFVSNL
jgi:hypothetical protein